MNDIKILENMRDNIYGEMQFEDDYQVSELEEKEFHALNSAITALKERQADKDRIKELEYILKFKSRKRKNGTMKYKKTNKLNKYGVNGVCQDMRALKRTGEIKYRAYITLFGKQHTLGTHSTLESAIQARKDGEKMIENILKNKLKESD